MAVLAALAALVIITIIVLAGAIAQKFLSSL